MERVDVNEALLQVCEPFKVLLVYEALLSLELLAYENSSFTTVALQQ